jgi:hypothetical protein
MTIDRTEKAAEQALLESREAMAKGGKLEAELQTILREEVVHGIFRLAWRHQFDDDRRQSKAALRQLVTDMVDEYYLESDSPAGD